MGENYVDAVSFPCARWYSVFFLVLLKILKFHDVSVSDIHKNHIYIINHTHSLTDTS